MERKKQQSGFTLIELLIVVAIVGILSAVALPLYQKYIARSQLKEALAVAASAEPLVEDFLHRNGSFPTTANFTEMGLPVNATGVVIGNKSATMATIEAVAASTGNMGGVQITLNTTVRPEVQGLTVTYRKNTPSATDPGVWTCTIADTPTSYTSDLTPPGCGGASSS